MNLLFFTEARLLRSAGGKFYAPDQSFSYQMLKRYLSVFEKVLVVARTTPTVSPVRDERTIVDGGDVKVLPLPYFIGPYQYTKNRNKLMKALRAHIDSHSDAAVICRVPGTIGTSASRYLTKIDRSYGVEVVGDPLDVFAPGSFNHPLRAVFRHSGAKNLKVVVKAAAASLYVTKASLQARYPPAENAFSTYASNVMLTQEAFAAQAKMLKSAPPYSLAAIGTLSAMYKSPDVVIEAMAILKKRGLRVSLQWLGDGRYRSEMVDLAKQAGVADIIMFVGNVGSAAEVRSFLDAADLFVLPSRVEGLPRAFVEAMARGLPCIGTDIGGIPELLDKRALVPVNNAKMLAEKIIVFLTNSGLVDAQAKRNLEEAQNYAIKLLEARRTKFYQYLKSIS